MPLGGFRQTRRLETKWYTSGLVYADYVNILGGF
jgi:hypothetical protein